ncbi:MAG: tetratricopeptide repeat protein [Microcoleaceae cyanobacterium]
MTKHWLRVIHQDETIRLSWQRGQANPRITDPVPFQHPFNKKALTNIRWYLEEYLRYPYGIYPDQAKQIESQFQAWGQQLFELIFRSTERGRDFFQEATRAGLDDCELGIISDNPTILNLPWELLYSPDDLFLAPKLAGIYRSLSDFKVRAELPELPNEKLNILLIIARPYEQDIGFQTIARPMVEALKPIGDRVNLKVLRPPSFTEFERELNAHKKGFYHIVHFDGHGTFTPDDTDNPQFTLRGSGQGELVFETLDGKPEVVTADCIAQSLQDCRVPVFVLNACKSAQEGEEQFSSVASRLVFSGAMGVVAMAYSVYADAAREFMGRFYGELTTGTTISEAVAKARLSVLNQPLRQSPRGKRQLQDWLVPILYQQESYQPYVPLQQDRNSFLDILNEIENNTDTTSPTHTLDIPDTGTYGFIGRGYDILRLERGFRQNNIVLLQGVGGVGKTELTIGFAHWLQDTNGRGNIFFTSFEQGATLNTVINQIGRGFAGDRFSQLPLEKQEQVVIKYLQTNPCLLIWDNFEPVAGFAGNEPLVFAEEQDRLKGFLKAMRDGKSWVLITSRQDEPWLDCGYIRLNLSGLSKTDVEEFAAKILQTVDVKRDKLPAEYLDLLKLLGGHPLSLRVVLPHLRNHTPTQLITALQQGLDTFAEGETRDKSLLVSLDFSFNSLSPQTQKHLPFLGLFSQRVYIEFLCLFSRNSEDEYGQAYRAVFGDNLQKEQWQHILNEATAASILEHLGQEIYQLHPTLPWYLRRRLVNMPIKNSQEEVAKLEKKLLEFYADFVKHFRQQLISNAKLASSILWVEEPNLLQYLRLAEHQHDWNNAQAILQALGEIYRRNNRKPKFNALKRRILKQIGTSLTEAKAKGKEAFNLWIYVQSSNANDVLKSDNWEDRKGLYQEIIDELIASKDTSKNDEIAVFCHKLGIIFQQQREFKVAVQYYQKAVVIWEDMGHFYTAANTYHQLGNVAFEQQQFDQAMQYYQQALTIFKDTGDAYKAANVYHQLGMVAQEQQNFKKAIQDYHKALKAYQDAGDLYNSAKEYHHLGNVAFEQQQFEKAIKYYHRAMKIWEDSEDFYNASNTYHQLGMVAQEQQQFEVAVQYHYKALKIFESVRDFYKVADEYYQLGNIAFEQRNFEKAVQYYRQVLNIREDAGDFSKTANVYYQLGMLAQEQQQLEKAIKFYRKAVKIFEDAGDLYSAVDEYYQLGNVAHQQQNFEEAVQFYQKAVKIFEDAGDLYKAANVYNQLGTIAYEQQNFEEAVQFYQKAVKIFEDAGDLYNGAGDYCVLGMLAKEQKQFKEAVQYSYKSLKIFAEAKEFDKAGYPMRQLGNILQELGENQFKAVWREAIGEEIPEEWYSAIIQINQQS